jgi:hypothetical protein
MQHLSIDDFPLGSRVLLDADDQLSTGRLVDTAPGNGGLGYGWVQLDNGRRRRVVAWQIVTTLPETRSLDDIEAWLDA